jgi:hypothetical protein
MSDLAEWAGLAESGPGWTLSLVAGDPVWLIPDRFDPDLASAKRVKVRFLEAYQIVLEGYPDYFQRGADDEIELSYHREGLVIPPRKRLAQEYPAMLVPSTPLMDAAVATAKDESGS